MGEQDGEQDRSSAPASDIAGTGVDAALLERLLPHLGESLMVLDRQWNVKANLAPPGGLIGRGLGIGLHTLEDMHPDDALKIMDLGIQAFNDTAFGWEGSMVVRMQRGDGTYGRYEITATNRFDDPVVNGLVVRTREVIAESEQQTPGLEDRLAAELAELLPTGVVVLDPSGRPVYVNGAACGILHTGPEDLKREGLVARLAPSDQERFAAAVDRVTRVAGRETCTVGLEGGRLVVECTLASFGQPVAAVIATLEDVTARHQAEALLEHRANHDDLTGLRNRASLLDLLRQRIDEGRPTAVAYLDLDGFKRVNDLGGHADGDRLLVAVAQCLDAGLVGAIVGRIGGDEFVVVADRSRATVIEAEVQSIVAAVSEAHDVAVGVSVGVTVIQADDEPRAVLHRADEAMYQDKRSRRRHVSAAAVAARVEAFGAPRTDA